MTGLFRTFSRGASCPMAAVLKIVSAIDLVKHGIKRYNVIQYVHDNVEQHYRSKRSTDEYKFNPKRILTLELFDKNITLILKQNDEFLATNSIHLGDEHVPFDSSILYEGYVDGYPSTSYVIGGFYSSWFDGVIKYSNETYHIEPSIKYSKSIPGVSIIYNALDVIKPDKRSFRSKRYVFNEEHDSSSFCGLNNKRREQMNVEAQRLKTHHTSSTTLNNDDDQNDNDFKSRYTSRSKRSSNSEKTCCYIYIRVDPTLWDIIYKNEGLNDKEPTIHAIVTFLYRTVTAANALYRTLKFESNGETLHRFTIRIKRIRILTPTDCLAKNLSISETNICRSYLDSNVLLTWHSAEDFQEYCLAYIFAARDFGDGTLGLAWMGSVASNSRGGICEQPARDIYEGERVLKTLNTGMVTIINHNTRTSSLMTELTFAHEVGHNLGAEHDDEKCGGDSTHGHYIMYRRATTGLEDNNNKFSNCSMEKMGPVMIAVKLGKEKKNCLTECTQVGYCGNRNVEDDEECDCGFTDECTDKCCYPAGGPNAKLGCRLRSGSLCSPSKGPCCSDDCTFQTNTHICHRDTTNQECIGNVRCDGIRATCPMNDTKFFKSENTPCNQNTALCEKGQCTKSICTLINRTECTLTISNVAEPLRQRGIDREYLCHIGCLDARTNTCVDTLTLGMRNNATIGGLGYKHRPGHACAGTTGYCDVFGKCRAVDADGPLTRLKNMLLNEENIRTFTQSVKARARTNAFVSSPPLPMSNGEHLNLQSRLFVRQSSSNNNHDRLHHHMTNTAHL
ncbi:unnamed protein product [Didymodactylos carnosus]|uniref:ADAM10 endopeptidase n=1 Tax=Didymodactylos carnosus TaxID=1234261 RepID=A0A813UTI5_9BILA|nr:unnamed protein product [Didymodactylos carnosus]CAF0827172.1 unnamed protein product [Didymodactylos carnosus]CAF3561598.1 unnamed protein product [Didymodactylos carnosus]CAF3614119.1 unnamed protein product [Didymodactylos carnosus]